MNTLYQIPLLRIAILFILGIACGSAYYVDIPLTILFILIISTVYVYIKKQRLLFGLFIHISLFFIGYASFTFAINPILNNPILAQVGKIKIKCIAKNENHEAQRNHIKCKCETIDKSAKQILRANGNIYLENKIPFEKIKIGDTLILSSYINKLTENNNPYAFDYARYLGYQGITFTGYASKEEWRIQESVAQISVQHGIHTVKEYCKSVFKKHIAHPDYNAITSALFLGDRSQLSQTIKTAYSDTGAMHVLAVSGLHVGIFVKILSFFLFLLPTRTTKQKIFKSGLLILGVWLFALLTGCSASVVRASIMFTIFIIACTIHKTKNIINIIGLTALGMLVYNPLYLFHVGFQLSFLALLGIVLFYNLILPSWKSKNFVLQQSISFGKLAIAAQLMVWPISVFYFKKFSLVFILSSIVVVWLAFMIIPLGIFLILLDTYVPDLALLIGYIMNLLLFCFVESVLWLQSFSFASIDNLYLDHFQLLSCYVLMIGILFYIKKSRTKGLYIALISLVILLLYSGFKKYTALSQDKVTVYDTRGFKCIDIFIGQKVYTYYTGSPSKKSLDFIAKNHRLASGIKDVIDLTQTIATARPGILKQADRIILKDKVIVLPDEVNTDFRILTSYDP